MAKLFINELKDGQVVDSHFSVKYKKPPAQYKTKSGSWFTAGLSDKSGEIELRFWGRQDSDSVKKVFDSFRENDVVRVKGMARMNARDSRLEIHVNEGEGLLEKTEEFPSDDFIPKTKSDSNAMMNVILDSISEVDNPHINQLLADFFNDKQFIAEFMGAPGGITMHHAYIGGLLEHTVHVLQICKALIKIYPQLDKNLVLAGAILHDIGKIKEFRVTTNIKQTEEGMLRGHIAIGEEMVLDRIKRMGDFPKDLRIKVAHIMLAHHGQNEYGSPVQPVFAEAEAIHYADECDARLDQHIDTKQNPGTEDFRVWSKKLGRPVYLK